ncbi:hypothetical protein ONS96_004648 [Cadophora gregata f. sp. sojae]|nr:hypothetical protein ONS96_004648 [Cadophora gregata f. sp. sojae]
MVEGCQVESGEIEGLYWPATTKTRVDSGRRIKTRAILGVQQRACGLSEALPLPFFVAHRHVGTLWTSPGAESELAPFDWTDDSSRQAKVKKLFQSRYSRIDSKVAEANDQANAQQRIGDFMALGGNVEP